MHNYTKTGNFVPSSIRHFRKKSEVNNRKSKLSICQMKEPTSKAFKRAIIRVTLKFYSNNRPLPGRFLLKFHKSPWNVLQSQLKVQMLIFTKWLKPLLMIITIGSTFFYIVKLTVKIRPLHILAKQTVFLPI